MDNKQLIAEIKNYLREEIDDFDLKCEVVTNAVWRNHSCIEAEDSRFADQVWEKAEEYLEDNYADEDWYDVDYLYNEFNLEDFCL